MGAPRLARFDVRGPMHPGRAGCKGVVTGTADRSWLEVAAAIGVTVEAIR